jgi:hypothetical protein
MANSFLTPSIIGKEALMILENELVAANLFHRGHADEFKGAKVGDTISIRGPASFTAQEFTSTVTTQDATESSRSLQLEKHFDTTFAVTSKQWSLNLEDFKTQLLTPAIVSIAQAIDSYILGKGIQVPNFVGTATDPPDSLADLTAVVKKLDDLKVPQRGRIGIVDSQAKHDMLNISNVIQADQRGQAGVTAMQEASMGRIMGLDYYMDQNVASHTAATLADYLVNDASAAIGDTTVTIDGGSGTIKAGDLFTIAGDSTQYVVLTTNGSTSMTIQETGLVVAAANNAAITFQSNSTHVVNLAGHGDGITYAIVPLELPAGAARAEYVADRGLGLRIVFDYSASTKTDTISLDVLCGAKVQQGDLLTRVFG